MRIKKFNEGIVNDNNYNDDMSDIADIFIEYIEDGYIKLYDVNGVIVNDINNFNVHKIIDKLVRFKFHIELNIDVLSNLSNRIDVIMNRVYKHLQSIGWYCIDFDSRTMLRFNNEISNFIIKFTFSKDSEELEKLEKYEN